MTYFQFSQRACIPLTAALLTLSTASLSFAQEAPDRDDAPVEAEPTDPLADIPLDAAEALLADAVVDPAIKKQQYEEFLLLAPYLGLNSPMTLDDLDKETIEQNLNKIDIIKDARFQSGSLREVGPSFWNFLDERRKSVMPRLELPEPVRDAVQERAVLDAMDGEIATPAVFLAFAELYSRWWQDAQLLSWQVACDRRCRTDYRKLLPIARANAGPVNSSDQLISLDFSAEGWRVGRVTAQHGWEQPLRNVTLIVDKISADGRSLRHYYFFAEWQPKQVVALRPAADWCDVGGPNTIGGFVELLSENVSSGKRKFVLENNVKMSVPRTLDAMRAVSPLGQRARPGTISARTAVLENALVGNPGVIDQLAAVRELKREVSKDIERRVADLQKKIGDRQKAADDLLTPGPKESSEKKERRLKQRTKIMDEIKSLKKQQADVRKP